MTYTNMLRCAHVSMQGMSFVGNLMMKGTACFEPTWHQTVTTVADVHSVIAGTAVMTQQQNMSSATMSQHNTSGRLVV